jgi:coproporphyrinogen III oxidase-like Fe-S oxidoreductase
MVKTIAQALIEEGEKIGKIRAKRDTLIMILRERFKISQQDVTEKVRSIEQVEELDELIDRAITANTFEDVGIHKK